MSELFIDTKEGGDLLKLLTKEISDKICNVLHEKKITVQDAMMFFGTLYSNLIAFELLHFHLGHSVCIEDIDTFMEIIKRNVFIAFKENVQKNKETIN